jgi:hypothetical protein
MVISVALVVLAIRDCEATGGTWSFESSLSEISRSKNALAMAFLVNGNLFRDGAILSSSLNKVARARHTVTFW